MPNKWNETCAADYEPVPVDGVENPSWDNLFPRPPPPVSPLAEYRLLAPTAGVRVSPFTLGAMNIGNQYSPWFGRESKLEDLFKYLDAYFDAGGNFIDTANMYQDGQSEHILGEWMEKRQNRAEIVLATKYTNNFSSRVGKPKPGIAINYVGNSKKSLKISLDESLRRLRTDYIDIFYVHLWDYTTPIEELMQSLNDVVRSGKVLYLGISDTPAWIVSKANQYARDHGLAQFVIYQGLWNLATRDVESDIIPMCRAEGMAFTAWGAMGSGKFKTPAQLAKRPTRMGHPLTPAEEAATAALERVAEQLNKADPELKATITGVAMAWTRHKIAYSYPLVGGDSIPHLLENIQALKIQLSTEQVAELDQAVPLVPRFPMTMGTDPHFLPGGISDGHVVTSVGHLKFVTGPFGP